MIHPRDRRTDGRTVDVALDVHKDVVLVVA